MSQRERILTLLRERGGTGVHSFEFYELRMPRGAAVIHALRKDGLDITSRHERYCGEADGVRYVLRAPGPNRPMVAPASPGLFAAEPAPSSAFDPWSDFA